MLPLRELEGCLGADRVVVDEDERRLLSTDFYAAFSDGSSLTTTLKAGEGDVREAKIYKRSFPGVGLAELLEKHEAGVAELTKGGVMPLPAEPSLRGLADAVDGFLKRMGV